MALLDQANFKVADAIVGGSVIGSIIAKFWELLPTAVTACVGLLGIIYYTLQILDNDIVREHLQRRSVKRKERRIMKLRAKWQLIAEELSALQDKNNPS